MKAIASNNEDKVRTSIYQASLTIIQGLQQLSIYVAEMLLDFRIPVGKQYTQSPLIRTAAKWPTLGVLKNSSNLDAHRFLVLQVWALAGS